MELEVVGESVVPSNNHRGPEWAEGVVESKKVHELSEAVSKN